MASYTLDHLRAAVKKKYSSYDIDMGSETLSLRNPLLLEKGERKQLNVLLRSIGKSEIPDVNDKKGEDESDEDFKLRVELEREEAEKAADAAESSTTELLVKIIRLVADKDSLALALIAELGADNLPILMVLVEEFMEEVKVGEA